MFISQVAPSVMPSGTVLGQTFPNQPVAETLKAREFEQARQGVSGAVGGEEARGAVDALLAGLQKSGAISDDQHAKMQGADIGETAAMIMPYAGMFGANALDSIGLGGYQMGANMTNMLRGAHHSGDLSAQQLGGMATDMSQQVMQNLYSDPSGKNTETYGISKGFGSELTLIGQDYGQTASSHALAGMTREERGDSLTKSTKGLSRGASAIRDLGGGFSNLNPEQTMDMLDKLSMGGLSQGDDINDIATDIREYKQLTRGAGISNIEGAGLKQIAGARSEELGGKKSSGTEYAAHAAAFGGYLRSGEGKNALARSGMSKNELMQQDAILTAQAGNSEMGNRAAALMRMGEQGGMLGADDSAANVAYRNLRDNDELDPMSAGQFNTMLQKSGVDMSEARTAIGHRAENKEKFGDRVAGAVRSNQWETSLGKLVGMTVANQLSAGKGGMSDKRAAEAGAMVADTLHNSGGMSRDETEDKMREGFRGMGLGEQAAKSAVMQSMGAAGIAAERKGYKSIDNMVVQHSKQAMAGVRERREDAVVEAKKEEAASPDIQKFGERTIGSISQGDNLATVVARGAGAVEPTPSPVNGGGGVGKQLGDSKGNPVWARLVDDDGPSPAKQ